MQWNVQAGLAHSVAALLLVGCASPGVPLDTGRGDGSIDAYVDGGASPDGRDGSTGADGATGTDASADVPLPPLTVSSWMGTNVSGDLPWVDLTNLMAPFDTPTARKDANGYPVAGASGTSSTDLGFQVSTGVYNIAFTGDGTVTVGGIATLMGSWTTVAGEHRNAVSITGTPGVFGQMLRVTIANGASGVPVHNLRVLLPGYDYDTPRMFTSQFLALLTPFRTLRMMDWLATNNSTLANWADRPQASIFGAQPRGVPYERIVALVNLTGKDLWINIPEHATDDFVQQLAHFLRTSLDMTSIAAARRAQGSTAPFQLIIEYANETWNTGFSANATLLAAANANTALYTGTYTGSYGPSWMASNTNLMRVGQYEGDRLVSIGNAFRTEFALSGQASAIAPVLSGWALGAVYSDAALQFIQAHHGPPASYITYVALAPYVAPDDAQTGSLASLFASLESHITSMDGVFQDFARLAAADSLHIAAYEGGQGISGTANQMVKHLAQHDLRMYTAYQDFFTLWNRRFGESLFMHYSLAGTPGIPEFIYQYGFWGSIRGVMEDPAMCGHGFMMLTGSESIASVEHFCPKYEALREHVPH